MSFQSTNLNWVSRALPPEGLWHEDQPLDSLDLETIIPVSVKKHTSRTKNIISAFRASNHGAGEQFLLLDCRARACAKGVCFLQTPVSYYSILWSTILYNATFHAYTQPSIPATRPLFAFPCFVSRTQTLLLL